jgi:SAM-dependent methyltransferase
VGLTDDPREESLRAWESVAEGWKATRAQFQQVAMPVSQWMIEAIHPQPGHRVLELAAGLGDTGLLAAELVAPGGSVIITDGTEAMVRVAREHAEEVGATNVELRTMQAEWIDLPAASVDGVLCRFGYMLLVDPEAALRETRRVLKPGGRVAFAVWGEIERNPWLAVTRAALAQSGFAPPPPPGAPGPMALAAAGAVQELLETTGFDEIEVAPLEVAFEPPSLDAWWDHVMQTSPSVGDIVRKLAPADHYKLRDVFDAGNAPYVRDDGSLKLPGLVLVAAATA